MSYPDGGGISGEVFPLGEVRLDAAEMGSGNSAVSVGPLVPLSN